VKLLPYLALVICSTLSVLVLFAAAAPPRRIHAAPPPARPYPQDPISLLYARSEDWFARHARR
jgi:hypothetical protein